MFVRLQLILAILSVTAPHAGEARLRRLRSQTSLLNVLLGCKAW